jgi:hypothetical protein
MANLDHEDEELGVTRHVVDAPLPDPDAKLALTALERLGSGRPRCQTERLDSVGDAALRRGVERR